MTSHYRQEKQFGLVLSLIALVIGLWPLFDKETISWPWALASTALLLIALLAPVVLSPLFKAWMSIGHVLGIINNHLLLAIIFFIFITPLALFFRLTGRDALHMKQKKATSYWQKEEKKWPPESFKNQF